MRQFIFFDPEPVKDIHDPSSPPEIFKSATEISDMFSSSHGLVVADIHGSVHCLNQALVSMASWIAYIGERVTHMVERKGILITIGEEDGVRSSIMKIWDLGKTDNRTGGPTLLRTAKVTTLALTQTLSFLAVGLADGADLLYRHLDQSLSSASSNPIPKPRVIEDIPTEPVTFLGFTSAPTSVTTDALTAGAVAGPSLASFLSSDPPPTLTLIIVTTSSTYAYSIQPKPSSPASLRVDEIGAGLQCACVDWKERWVVLGRYETVVGIGSGGRSGVVSYEGPKLSLHTHLNYVAMVLPASTPAAPNSTPLASVSAIGTSTSRQRNLTTDTPSLSNVLLTKPGNAIDPDAARVVLVDTENKLEAYSGVFERGIRDVVSEWGSLYVLGNDGRLIRLSEKPTSTKLALLYEKYLYTPALSLAHTQNMDTTDVHLHHADYMYDKEDCKGVMKEYLRTIGSVRGSYVVRKFLTANLTPLLTIYLQESHAHGFANAEHTTLLLNTYAKVGDVAKVDAFVRSEGRVVGPVGVSGGAKAPGEGTSRDPPFDLDTAIRVCRQAGFFEHAAYLAKRWGRHEDYLRVVVEDIGAGERMENGYKEALNYLREVGGAAAELNLARYGRALLHYLPNETTQLFIDLCAIPEPLPSVSSSVSLNNAQIQTAVTPSYLSYLALSRAPAVPPASSAGEGADAVRWRPISISAPSRDTLPARPTPTLFFAHFVDHPGCFMTFLETVAERRWGQTLDGVVNLESGTGTGEDEEAKKRDQAAVWNTLLELYLTDGTAVADAERAIPYEQHKAIRLLHATRIPYDLMHALVLCSSHEYTPGLVLLWEKMGMCEDVLRFSMERYNSGIGASDWSAPTEPTPSTQVVSAIRKHGSMNPTFYPLVLRFLTSMPALLTKHQSDLVELLEYVEKMKTKLKQVEDLEDTGHPTVFHITWCSQCKGQLDLPSIHFMCAHSYHQRCLLENETACPLCTRQHGVQEIRRNNQRLADQHDSFLADVDENGFRAIAGGFGRGWLGVGSNVEVSG
ncbi:hypothetical protein BDN67DRAFT_990923 [Paxillus ammoniavirescens]|nr:hypothetical protein BDN67DRAFT_990923 [Paxillus ammoniavirescens]